jgi:hypothetical protein
MKTRRTFLRRSAAAAAVGFATTGTARAQATAGARPQPARHAKDDWFDEIPGVHRLFLDATTPQGAGEASLFASNFYSANKDDYAIEAKDLAVVICLRHNATQFAFNDAIWAKYGATLADLSKSGDASAGQASDRNPRLRAYTRLIDLGAHFAVCSTATRRIAGAIARKAGGDATADAIYKELVANAIKNSHMVAAGIVAVNRAQERGYSLSCAG